jgi:demethylmenaquinone methyltransferase/2-methoxy-6-polyprenyl-1,4-benzoquinol methylase
VVDVACGTGQNFPFLEQAIGPEGRIVGVDLTDAMLAEAQDRVETNDWRNASLVQSDAAGFEFPSEVDAILSTYALTQVTGCADVIAHGAAALRPGGRWTVLDLKLPDSAPRSLGRFGISDEWIARRPWEEIRVAMEAELIGVSWRELLFGTGFLASGRTLG